jgi:hypothetical protein
MSTELRAVRSIATVELPSAVGALTNKSHATESASEMDAMTNESRGAPSSEVGIGEMVASHVVACHGDHGIIVGQVRSVLCCMNRVPWLSWNHHAMRSMR